MALSNIFMYGSALIDDWRILMRIIQIDFTVGKRTHGKWKWTCEKW